MSNCERLDPTEAEPPGRVSARAAEYSRGWIIEVSIVTVAPTVKRHPEEMRLGVHLSLGNAPEKALAEARLHGATSVQIFASSPGAWKPPVLRELKVDSFLRGRHEHGISPAFIHAIYLINLASEDQVLIDRSRSSLRAAMEAAAALEVAGVITHLGSHGGRGFEAVAEIVAEGLLDVAESASPGPDLVLENSAGAGGILGSDLSELEGLIARTGHHPRVKIALDTAHLCAAGWDFREAGTAERLVEAVQSSVGLARLAAIHANDSKVPVGSRRDRHACVGEGYIGDAGFNNLLAQPGLTAVPWILETPDLDARLPPAERFRSIDRLRALIGKSE